MLKRIKKEVKRKLINNSDKLKFISLGWAILECKYEYYVNGVNLIEDYYYDKIEKEYIRIGKKLNLTCSASNMVGFDIHRPVCNLISSRCKGLVLQKVLKKYYSIRRYFANDSQ